MQESQKEFKKLKNLAFRMTNVRTFLLKPVNLLTKKILNKEQKAYSFDKIHCQSYHLIEFVDGKDNKKVTYLSRNLIV